MGHRAYIQNGKTLAYVTDFVVDTQSDMEKLPKMPAISPGSTCLVLDTVSVFMLNTEGEWKEL